MKKLSFAEAKAISEKNNGATFETIVEVEKDFLEKESRIQNAIVSREVFGINAKALELFTFFRVGQKKDHVQLRVLLTITDEVLRKLEEREKNTFSVVPSPLTNEDAAVLVSENVNRFRVSVPTDFWNKHESNQKEVLSTMIISDCILKVSAVSRSVVPTRENYAEVYIPDFAEQMKLQYN